VKVTKKVGRKRVYKRVSLIKKQIKKAMRKTRKTRKVRKGRSRYGMKNPFSWFNNKISPGPISPGPISPGPISPGPISPGPISPEPISPGPISPEPIVDYVPPYKYNEIVPLLLRQTSYVMQVILKAPKKIDDLLMRALIYTATRINSECDNFNDFDIKKTFDYLELKLKNLDIDIDMDIILKKERFDNLKILLNCLIYYVNTKKGVSPSSGGIRYLNRDMIIN
jgi:hypothetical protein